MDVVLKAAANTAFSFTLSGNSGISPFLTMFLIGISQKIAPQNFNMDETMEKIMSSWPSLVLWGVMAILEYVGKCVPVIDHIVDSFEIFVVPFMSTLGSFSSFGSFGSSGSDSDSNRRHLSTEGRKTHVTKPLRGRTLESTSSVSSSMKHFFQAILVFCGMFLALSLHFFKMFIRLMGEGCLTQCISIGEAIIVAFGVLMSVFIRQFAIFIAGCMCLAAAYGARRRYEKWQKERTEVAPVSDYHLGRI